MSKINASRGTNTGFDGVVSRPSTAEFRQKLFIHLGEDFDNLSLVFGVSKKTIYRWWNDANQVHPSALRLLDVIERGYLPPVRPFNEWKINGSIIYTPMGELDAYELETAIGARSYLHDLYEENVKLKTQLTDTGALFDRLRQLVVST